MTGPLDVKYRNGTEIRSADKHYNSASVIGITTEASLGYLFKGGNGFYIAPEAFFYQSGRDYS